MDLKFTLKFGDELILLFQAWEFQKVTLLPNLSTLSYMSYFSQLKTPCSSYALMLPSGYLIRAFKAAYVCSILSRHNARFYPKYTASPNWSFPSAKQRGSFGILQATVFLANLCFTMPSQFQREPTSHQKLDYIPQVALNLNFLTSTKQNIQ